MAAALSQVILFATLDDPELFSRMQHV